MAATHHEYDLIFKLLVIGDSGVGKSCLLNRYVDDIYYDTSLSTIGVDFKFKDIDLDGKAVKLQIWDTAGQEKFRTIVASYYRGAHGIVLAYDTSNMESFHSLGYWLQEIKRFAPSSSPVIVVGTKGDLPRQVPEDRVQAFAQQYCGPDAVAISTSAKDGRGVEQAFLELAQRVFKLRQPLQPTDMKPTIPRHLVQDEVGPGPYGACSC